MGRNHVILFPLIFAIRCHLAASLSLPSAILPSHLPPSGHLSSFDLGEDMGSSIFPQTVATVCICHMSSMCHVLLSTGCLNKFVAV